jgi:hypothetical protein
MDRALVLAMMAVPPMAMTAPMMTRAGVVPTPVVGRSLRMVPVGGGGRSARQNCAGKGKNA